jgi:hypothetical protein
LREGFSVNETSPSSANNEKQQGTLSRRAHWYIWARQGSFLLADCNASIIPHQVRSHPQFSMLALPKEKPIFYVQKGNLIQSLRSHVAEKGYMVLHSRLSVSKRWSRNTHVHVVGPLCCRMLHWCKSDTVFEVLLHY